MTLSLKPINIYQELEPYDVDVDNRPLIDINDNLLQIVSILEATGSYLEVVADASQEPAGLFTPFTCACVYSNNLLIPIDISKSISEIDYTKHPIVLVLSYLPETKRYACITFSAGIKLSNKFASFVPGSEGRLLRVGPGGELVDEMYYDLAHASKGYQALYAGKILTTNSIVFGGNQVNILGNNFYLAKNRDDFTSGLTTIQRGNNNSNVVFKSVNVNETGSPYNFAEYVNASRTPNSIYELPVPVYFASAQLSYNQTTGLFSDPSIETILNEVHFNTPSLISITNANQVYLTAGVNVRSLLEFNAANSVHSSAYSNTVSELSQDISTKITFTDRVKVYPSDPDIAIGLNLPAKTKSIGTALSNLTNQPNNLIPTVDTTGLVFGDYFGTTGGYFGAIQDESLLAPSRPSITDDQATLTATNALTSNIITDYSNSFTLLLAAKSTTTIPANLALSADGFLNLSSGKGILTNAKTPLLDLELTSKKYVDTQIAVVAVSDAGKIPLTGTVIDHNITGSLFIDVAGNSGSNTKIFTLKGINYVDISSYNKVRFTDASEGSPNGLQVVYGNTSVGAIPETGEARLQLVNKDFLETYVLTAISGAGASSFVTAGSTTEDATDQIIYGNKTFNNAVTSFVASGTTGLSLTNTSSKIVDFSVGLEGNLTIDAPGQILTTRETIANDDKKTLTTKGFVEGLVANVGAGYDTEHSNMNYSTSSLKNVDNNGWAILGNLVFYWCKTQDKVFPNTGAKDGGNDVNPEYEIGLPINLFSMVCSISATMTNAEIGTINNDDDVFLQVLQWDAAAMAATAKFKLKYQGSNSFGAGPLGASIFIVGLKGSLAGL